MNHLKRIQTRHLLPAFIALFLTACSTPDFSSHQETAVELNIPDRAWSRERPDQSVGWCAEACIQMVLAFYGEAVSQTEIHHAGSPAHPDLYMDDMDDALNELNVSCLAWDAENRNVHDFIHWIQLQLSAGTPVICGIKIYPDEHPDWFLDHFVVVVGYNAEGLLLNTQLDMDGQQRVSYKQLTSSNAGYSFKSWHRRYFARAIIGVAEDQ